MHKARHERFAGSGTGGSLFPFAFAGMEKPKRVVLVFVRAPQRGRVKTRLAAGIGPDAALRIYRRLAEHTVAEALRLPGVEVRVHYTPAAEAAAVRRWLGRGPLYLPQADGDLGRRLTHAFADAWAAGADRVLVVGSDLPDVAAELLERAFAELEAAEAVLGPARDGGYYLLALRRPVPGVFDGIDWSTERVLRQTVERLQRADAPPTLLEPLTDVDEVEDLPTGWAARAARPVS